MRDRRARGPLVLGALLLAAAAQPAEARPTRPDPLPGEAGCDRYRGVPIGANDSTQQFELSVCNTASGVRAKVQTSSLVSGWSVRASTGSWDAAGRVLTLSETEFIESRPEPGWRFCLIDELVLEKTDKGLEGTYVSRACDDRAELVLEQLEGVPAGAAKAPARVDAPSQGPSSPRSSSPPASEPTAGGCACSATAPSRTDVSSWLLVVIGALSTRRRRRGPCSCPS